MKGSALTKSFFGSKLLSTTLVWRIAAVDVEIPLSRLLSKEVCGIGEVGTGSCRFGSQNCVESLSYECYSKGKKERGIFLQYIYTEFSTWSQHRYWQIGDTTASPCLLSRIIE